MSEEKIQQLSMLEQNLTSIVTQRQTLHKQLLEIDNALTALETAEEGYQIVGTVMVKKSSKELKKDLEEKKKMITLRMSSYEKQENSLRSQMQSLQNEVMQGMNKENNNKK